MSLTVLLVEDDAELRATLRDALEVEGYRVFGAASLADARALLAHGLAHEAVDVALLDLGLPDGDGESLVQQLRTGRGVPVIVLSARHGDVQKVRLLDGGADDFLVKPFSLLELLARMRVAMRRRGRWVEPALTLYRHDGLEVDLKARQVRLQGVEQHLTPTEYALLARLVRSAGQVVTHRQLLTDVWGVEYAEHTHYLRQYMGQLRAKLEDEPANPRRVLTELGVGYRLAAMRS